MLAIRAEAIEEAAKVAGAGSPNFDGDQIATAIRSLMGKETGG